MKYLEKILLMAISIGLFGCAKTPLRSPSSVPTTIETETLQKILDLKQKKIELNALSVHYDKKGRDNKLEKNQDEISVINNEIEKLEKEIGSFQTEETSNFPHEKKDWRNEDEKIELTNLGLYKSNNDVTFSISTYESIETSLRLTQKIFTNLKYRVRDPYNDRPTLDMRMSCQNPFKYKYGLHTKKVKANEVIRFSLGDKKIQNDYRDFIFDKKLSECTLHFTLSTESRGDEYKFKLVNESNKLQALNEILSTTEVCNTQKGSDKFIETNNFTNMTCPNFYEGIQILPEPEDSLHARVIGLLGQDLPGDFIKNGNPYAELDFSKAPKLDAILVSYLVFRADFYGTLLARLLSYHADQGAFVRVIVSDVISLDKDIQMYEKLMAKHPNIKFVRYEFDKHQKGGAKISELHRTNHVKLFIVYSKDSAQDSMVIVGGRNVHDGFVFKKPIDVSKFPEIVNYVTGDESWAYWRDFEMVIRGQDFVNSMVRHYMNLYHINKDNLVMKTPSVVLKRENKSPTPIQTMRHYVSIPFKDGPNLNQFYAQLIDQSKKKILISSPYFRPVKEIGEALDRAISRGVDVTIITRLDLEGDTADFILGAVNKDGVNRFMNKVKVFEYTEPKVILHSKLLMIDDEVSFISSVNLNKRSFYHDLENGVVVNDPKFTKEMEGIYKEYMKISRRITEEQKIAFWKRWLIKALDKVF